MITMTRIIMIVVISITILSSYTVINVIVMMTTCIPHGCRNHGA